MSAASVLERLSAVDQYTQLVLASHATKNLWDAKVLWRQSRIVWSVLTKDEKKLALKQIGEALLSAKVKK